MSLPSDDHPLNALPAGHVLQGEYRIERVLGAGGFGITYLARDGFGRPVAVKEYLPNELAAHSTDRGHPFQADRGQRSRRSRTPWVWCLSDGVDGRPSVRHQFGTLSAMSVEQGLPGCPRGALAAGGQPGAEGVFGTVVVCCGSLVHGGGGACDATPPRWARRGRSGTRLARLGCRQAWALARRSDSPFSASVCEPCSSRSMMASAMVGSLSH